MRAQAMAHYAGTRTRRWLLLVRIVLVVGALFGAGSFAARLPGHFTDLQRVCAGARCSYGQLSPSGAQAFQSLGMSPAGYALLQGGVTVLVVLTWCIIAGAIAWRRWNDGPTLLVALWFVFVGASTITGSYGTSSAGVQPHDLTAQIVNRAAEFGTFSLVLALFPTRRVVPRVAFWLVVAFGYFIAAPLVFATSLSLAFRLATLAGLAVTQVYHYTHVIGPAQRRHATCTMLAILTFIGLEAALLMAVPFGGPLALVGFYTVVTWLAILQLVRYWRVAGPLARQQTKWAALGLSLFTVVAAVLLVPLLLTPSLAVNGSFYIALRTMMLITASLFGSFAIAFAILRYRLWDIDVLINRALVYGSLTALLVGIFGGVVFGLETLVIAITGQASQPVAVVVATLTIYALFQPLRGRVQGGIDRRFYRRKYDAAKTLAAFGATLRTEMDVAGLNQRLLAVIEETMQPEHVSLWLCPPHQRSEDPA